MAKRIVCWLAAAVLLLMGTMAGALADTPREIYPLDYDTLPEPRAGQYHYLMACVDTWEGSASNLGNTDGVLMVTLDVDAKRVMLTTFTREMLVKRPDGGIGRFTYIAKNYGPEALCETVSTHFGTKVDKYIIFSMDNVQTIIDAMGGVYITVTDAEADYLNRYRIARDATTPSMDKAGTYLFTGHAAVIYMRIRTVLSTLAGKYAQASLDDALQLITTVSENIVTTNMSMADLLEAAGYALELRGVEPEGIQMPPEEAMQPITYAGMATRQVDFEYSRQVLSEFLESQSFDVVE